MVQQPRSGYGYTGWVSALIGVTLPALFVVTDSALAQRRPIADDTLGEERSIVTPLDPDLPADVIEGGAERGDNLFHSFQEFHVDEGRGVYFDDRGFANIISRVTGGVASDILGVLGVIGDANLFLINPSGIIFGEGASLDVSGSFVSTTADAIQFGDQGFFNASDPNAPPLLTVQPSAFLFNQIQSGAIVNQSASLQVPNGQNLLLVGGNVSMDGGALNAYGGRVEIGGLLEPGAIALNTDGSLAFPIGVGRSDVSLTNEALIDVAAEGSGSIAINARNLDILGGSILATGIYGDSGSVGARAGDITLNAIGALEIVDSVVLNFVQLGALGNGGDITLTADSIALNDGATIVNRTFGQGNAGNITLSIADTLALNASNIGSEVAQDAIGNAGNITIAAGSIALDNGAYLSSSAFGEGNAGNIMLTVNDTLSLAGRGRDGFISNIRSAVFEGVGDAGNITITALSIRLNDGAGIISGNSGEGNGGNTTLIVADVLSLAGRDSEGEGSRIETALVGGLGNAGDLTITARSIRLNDGATLSSFAAGEGNAGDITLTVTDTLSLTGRDGGGSSSAIGGFLAEGVGNAGNLTITARSIRLNDGARLSSFVAGEGNAGDITLTVTDTLSLTGRDGQGFGSSISSEVSEEATGDGGNIRINAGSVVLEDGAEVSSSTLGKGNAGNVFVVAGYITLEENVSFDSSTFGEGNAGNITLDVADTLSLVGRDNDGLSSFISSAVDREAEGNGGEITITASSIILENGAAIFTNTFGGGNAGSITMTADSINLEDRAFINSSTSGEGDAGNITLNVANTLSLSGLNGNGDPSFIQSAVAREGRGNGGEIAITASSITLEDGAGIFTNTFGEGNAGNILLNIRDTLSLTGRDGDGRGSRIESSVAAIADGNQGTIIVTTDSLSLMDGARLTVNNAAPQGEGGDIEIQARNIELDEASEVTAETASGQGGNITLSDVELLQLRNESLISTTAGRQQAEGDGGNITIDADFIVAFPNENSDIRANAFSGSGGRIDITTEGLFGIEERDPPTEFSDITASSELGVQGTININTPDVDPSRGLTELPEDVVDASDQIAQTCPTDGNVEELGEFVVTGRGGLPANPAEILGGETVLMELAEVEGEGDEGEGERGGIDRPSTATNPQPEIVEAQGWVVGADGKVILTAENPAVEPHSSPIAPVPCPRS